MFRELAHQLVDQVRSSTRQATLSTGLLAGALVNSGCPAVQRPNDLCDAPGDSRDHDSAIVVVFDGDEDETARPIRHGDPIVRPLELAEPATPEAERRARPVAERRIRAGAPDPVNDAPRLDALAGMPRLDALAGEPRLHADGADTPGDLVGPPPAEATPAEDRATAPAARRNRARQDAVTRSFDFEASPRSTVLGSYGSHY